MLSSTKFTTRKMNASMEKKKRKRAHLLMAKTQNRFLRKCSKASRRRQSQSRKCKQIQQRQSRNQLLKTVDRLNSFMRTATSKRKQSLFQISCSARCKSKINQSCHMRLQRRTIFTSIPGVKKCGRFQQISGTRRRIFSDCSWSSQIFYRVTHSQQMSLVDTVHQQTL